jgi:predicted aconitase with swiveling domain
MSVKGKVLVFPEPRGSGGFNMFGRTRVYGVNPAAFLYRSSLALTILASMEMQAPSLTDFDKDPIDCIHTGDWVLVDADNGIVTVQRRIAT